MTMLKCREYWKSSWNLDYWQFNRQQCFLSLCHISSGHGQSDHLSLHLTVFFFFSNPCFFLTSCDLCIVPPSIFFTLVNIYIIIGCAGKEWGVHPHPFWLNLSLSPSLWKCYCIIYHKLLLHLKWKRKRKLNFVFFFPKIEFFIYNIIYNFFYISLICRKCL